MSGPSLLTIARRALTGEASIAKGSTVIVATSGGPDSMALLDVLARLGPKLGLSVRACGVDHGLRAEAAKELDLAEAHADRVGVPFARRRVSVGAGSNLQERARTARWKALAAEARRRGANAIATAHHADDRAETFLLRMLRGAGVRGLAVLPARAPAPFGRGLEALRPLLRARRADILAHLERHGIAFAEDPSNRDPRFLRARVRHEVLPLLEELDPAVVRHLSAIADELCEAHSPGEPLPHWTDGLPRPTREAIRKLLLRRSRTARVWLPGGLAVGIAERAKRS